MNDDGYKELALAVVKQAVADCRTEIKRLNRKEKKLEAMSFELGGKAYEELGQRARRDREKVRYLFKWLNGEYCKFLLQDTIHPDEVIKILRKEMIYGI